MRKSSLRLFGFAMPLACLAAMPTVDFEANASGILMYLMLLTASLGAPDAFSRCAAKQMSTKKVMGSLLGAIVLTLLFPVGINVYFSAIGENSIASILATASFALLIILRCFEELFASQNDTMSATITTALTTIAMSTSLLLDVGNTVAFAAMAVVTLISGSIALGFSRHEWPRINFAILKEIPAAMARLLLYPAFCIGILLLNNRIGANFPVWRAAVSAGLAGLILLEIFKSTFRRSPEEAAGIKVGIALSMLAATAGILLLGCFIWRTSFPLCQAILMAAGAAALLLYASFDWETIAATAILLAAAAVTVIGITPGYLPFPKEVFIGPAAGVALCVLMLRQWGQLFRQARANRIRKRAMKKSRS